MLGELTTAPRFTGSDQGEYFGVAGARRAIRTTAIKTFRIEAIVVPFWGALRPLQCQASTLLLCVCDTAEFSIAAD